MNRRNLLAGMAGIFAASAAPAILTQGTAMKIWVPPPRGVLTLDRLLAIKARMERNQVPTAVDQFGQRGYVSATWQKRAIITNKHWMMDPAHCSKDNPAGFVLVSAWNAPTGRAA